ncbi:hypothetical protein AB0D04_18095 [Streptomyces sp. NPDC048483]|uniref:nuclear transport factor 2 family protein n=1 Tax=Streptomyces sp. NPDC048483 TaxID=3154927 RepID=UPI00343DE499
MSETRSVVDAFYSHLGNGDIDKLADLFAEEIDWDIYGAEEVPWTGRRATRTEAVALGRMRHMVKATGKTFASPFAFHLTVEEGKITRYVTFEDSLALARAFGAV